MLERPRPSPLEALAGHAARLGAARLVAAEADTALWVRELLEAARPRASTPAAWLVDVQARPGGTATRAVSVAAAVDGEVVAAAVADAGRGELFTASLGGGARCDGRAIVTAAPGSIGARVDMGPFVRGSRERDAAVADRVRARVGPLRECQAPALAVCWVADGRLDGYFARGVSVAAAAASALVAEEAGARTELACPENAELLVVAAPWIWAELRAAVEAPAD